MSRAPQASRCMLLLLGLVAGCSEDPLQRMVHQPKVKPYQESPFFQDGRAMRLPPEGTVAREQELGPPGFATGRANDMPGGEYLSRIPVPLTRVLLHRGQKRFEISCAPCHGRVGEGDSIVARNMALRPPPSLHLYRDRPPGFLFDIITQGYGLMGSYASEIPPADRWAVVGYVQALQRSQHQNLDSAPEHERQRLLGEPP